ncbi:citrate lyase acyl carrier protein [Enterococcus sp. AZ109]|uniref:citrate lyase acyl carrier protein n=1 Tax=Enterococcus sp. AZ109 TaxID=2774634 RepID=UPI003F29482A
MRIEKNAIAGTLESSDVQVTIEPSTNGIELTIQSSVMNQYGRQIKKVVLDTLTKLEVEDAAVIVIDKGALECTLKARVECAVFRSLDASHKNVSWEVL